MYTAIRNTKGSSLLIVFLIGMVVLSVSMVSVLSTKSTTSRINQRRNSVNLLNIAEAGKEHGLALLRNRTARPPSMNTDSVLLANVPFDCGNYTVRCSTGMVDSDPMYRLSSTATYENQAKTVEVTCANPSIRPYDSCKAFDYFIYSGGDVTWKCGSVAGVNNGCESQDIHANGLFFCQAANYVSFFGNVFSSTRCSLFLSPNGFLNGSATAPLIGEKFTGRIRDGANHISVPAIVFPEIDFNPFREYALKNSQYYPSSQTIMLNGPYTVNGGIMYVDGNCRLMNTNMDVYTFTGSIIATGSILIDSLVSCQTTNPDYPVLASLGASDSISINTKRSAVTITGLIYTKNKFVKTGTPAVALNGQILSKNVFYHNASQSSMSITYQRSVPNPPDGYIDSTYAVTSWREL